MPRLNFKVKRTREQVCKLFLAVRDSMTEIREPRILITEDDFANQKFLQLLLKRISGNKLITSPFSGI